MQSLKYFKQSKRADWVTKVHLALTQRDWGNTNLVNGRKAHSHKSNHPSLLHGKLNTIRLPGQILFCHTLAQYIPLLNRPNANQMVLLQKR